MGVGSAMGVGVGIEMGVGIAVGTAAGVELGVATLAVATVCEPRILRSTNTEPRNRRNTIKTNLWRISAHVDPI